MTERLVGGTLENRKDASERTWTTLERRRLGDVEVFVDPTGQGWVKAGPLDTAQLTVTFRSVGLQPIGLVKVEDSRAARRHARKERRLQREMNKRGY